VISITKSCHIRMKSRTLSVEF